MTVHCNKGCGRTWPRHPVLEVDCPACPATAGSRCKRPSGHQAADYHHARVLLAYDEGHFGSCPWECCRPEGRTLLSERAGADLPLFAALDR